MAESNEDNPPSPSRIPQPRHRLAPQIHQVRLSKLRLFNAPLGVRRALRGNVNPLMHNHPRNRPRHHRISLIRIHALRLRSQHPANLRTIHVRKRLDPSIYLQHPAQRHHPRSPATGFILELTGKLALMRC